MSEQDRGAYAPQTDAPLAFDPRRPRGGGGGGPAPLTLLVSGIVLMAMVVGVLMFYRHGVRHPGQAPEVVGAPVTATKSAPSGAAASGDQVAGLQVYKAEVTPPGEGHPSPSFETPPEQPAPLPAARPVQPPPAVITQAPLRGAASAPAAPAAPKPVAVAKAAPPPPAPLKPAAPPAQADNSYVAGSAFEDTPPPPARAAAATPKPAPAKAAVAAKPVPAKPAPVEAAAAAPKAPAVAKPKPAAKTPSVSPETASAAPSGPAGGVMVQIGAFSSAALAQMGLSDDAHAVGSMAGKPHKVEAASKDGKTFYRAYVGGFASRAEAASFCEALKAKSKPCFIK